VVAVGAKNPHNSSEQLNVRFDLRSECIKSSMKDAQTKSGGLLMKRFTWGNGAPTVLVVALVCFSASLQCSVAETVILEFPALSQKNPANYRDRTVLDVPDAIGGGTQPVKNLACLATVYTMIERGAGNASAMIDDFYPDPREYGNNTAGATRPAYITGDLPYDAQRIIASLSAHLPVVLHGYGGPLKEHFALIVGYRKDHSATTFLVLDPWPCDGMMAEGTVLEIPVNGVELKHPSFKAMSFTQIREVVREKLAWNKIQLADPNTWPHDSVQQQAGEPTTGTGEEATEETLWATTPAYTVKQVLAAPDACLGKTFRFYGSVGEVRIGEGQYYFSFQEVVRTKMEQSGDFTGWGDWFKMAEGGPSIRVNFNKWYKTNARSIEGKNRIRDLARLRSASASSMLGVKYDILATVSEYEDTFLPYLSLVAMRKPEKGGNGKEACLKNRRQIWDAKEQAAMRDNLADGRMARTASVSMYVAGGLQAMKCPSGGKYVLHAIGSAPECTLHGKQSDWAANKASEKAGPHLCRKHLRQIDLAKEMVAMRDNLDTGATPSLPAVSSYIKGGLKALKCPSGGKYVLHRIGTLPECTVHGSLGNFSAKHDQQEIGDSSGTKRAGDEDAMREAETGLVRIRSSLRATFAQTGAYNRNTDKTAIGPNTQPTE